ncbi:MAG: ArsR family transcriptional regulator [Thermoplasmatota archaeon]|jgi:predicted transcriptional regulator
MEQKANPQCALTSVIENELDILKRHIHILNVLQEHQPMGIIKISEYTGYPQHMVRYSLRILEQEGLIEPSSKGAVTTKNMVKAIEELKLALSHIGETSKELSKEVK